MQNKSIADDLSLKHHEDRLKQIQVSKEENIFLIEIICLSCRKC